jgi:Flp pilus assembly protein TadD
VARALLLACVALLAACAHGRRGGEARFVCPSHGGPEWLELTTDHFVMATDLRRKEAARLARQLEAARAWVTDAIFPEERPELPTRVRVVAFRTMAEFDEFAPPALRGYFTTNGLGETVVVLPPELGKEGRIIVAHELTHVLAARVYLRQPRWFSEGIAALAEAMADDDERFGKLPAHRARGYRRQAVPVREILRWNGQSPDSRHHDTAAVLVHYLLDREPKRFAEVRRRLREAMDPEVTWRTVFPEWSPERANGPEELDEELASHARQRPRRGRKVLVEARAEPTLRTLSPGEVHEVRLSLTRFARGEGITVSVDATRAELAEALAEDPDHVLALQAKSELEDLDPLPLARRATQKHPESVRAWLWRAAAADKEGLDDEQHEALRRAVALAPDSPTATNNLAWFLLGAGREREALPIAERAARLAPGDPNVLDTYAGVLEALGRCVEALDLAERGLELLPADTPESGRVQWLDRALRLRRTCTPAVRAVGSSAR